MRQTIPPHQMLSRGASHGSCFSHFSMRKDIFTLRTQEPGDALRGSISRRQYCVLHPHAVFLRVPQEQNATWQKIFPYFPFFPRKQGTKKGNEIRGDPNHSVPLLRYLGYLLAIKGRRRIKTESREKDLSLLGIVKGVREHKRKEKMGSMEFESNNCIWDGVYYYPHLFGGIMLTVAVLGLSTSYFSGIGVPSLPFFWLDLGIFQKRKYRKKPVRVYMDGCFDLMHYGHANALRQARALGDELVVGVVSDEQIIANKGPPVLSMDERLVLVSGLKWVDEVIAEAPYEITEDFMNTLFSEHKIDYIIHGDDPCLLPDGTDAYALAKKVGRYKQIKRTEGVSSTDIVGRILLSMKDTKVGEDPGESLPEQSGMMNNSQAEVNQSNGAQISHFLPTSRRIMQFSNGKGPGPNARVVYIDGAFDLFHAGHVEILKIARQLGDFLLVGIHSDQTVSEHHGPHRPIMHLHERSLSVLACRYVDEVIMGAPWEVTKDMMTTFNISLVVHGTVAESNRLFDGETDPYAAPKGMGIFQIIESPRNITTSSVAKRIIANHDIYKKRNSKKAVSERKYYTEKKHVVGD